ncbi:MFS family permease [Paraburkholderia sp. 40]
MTDGLPNPQRAFAYIAIAIAMTMSVLDTSIVNVALPTISNDLAVSPANAIWVVNAYQLAITVSLLPLAVLGDSLGYKRVYCYGLALFTLASFACANAHTLLVLAVARVFQGFGAAGIMSVNIALVRFVFPKARLGVGVGYSSLVVAVSSAAGPSIASAILSVAHWQWLFLVNVPLGVLALSIGARTLPATPTSGARLSGLSVLLNALTFGLLISGLAAFNQAGATQRGAMMVAIALVAGVLFVRRESRLATPMLPIDLLRMPVFSLSMATSICSFAAQTMAYIVLPFYFEQTLKLSETQTGILMTPWPLVTARDRVDRTGRGPAVRSVGAGTHQQRRARRVRVRTRDALPARRDGDAFRHRVAARGLRPRLRYLSVAEQPRDHRQCAAASQRRRVRLAIDGSSARPVERRGGGVHRVRTRAWPAPHVDCRHCRGARVDRGRREFGAAYDRAQRRPAGTTGYANAAGLRALTRVRRRSAAHTPTRDSKAPPSARRRA